jgi:hypothetical protein
MRRTSSFLHSAAQLADVQLDCTTRTGGSLLALRSSGSLRALRTGGAGRAWIALLALRALAATDETQGDRQSAT